MKKTGIVILICAFILSPELVFGRTVTVRSVSTGIYEDGEYSPANDYFEGQYTIDENKRIITLDRVVKSTREGKTELNAEYDLSNMVQGEGFSALVVSRNKMGQKIFTGVREAELGASEILVIGEDFYEFCRAENGAFYLEHGEAISEPGRSD